MGCDRATLKIDEYETINGIDVPIDESGQYLDWKEINQENGTALALTDPYGALYFAVGNGECDDECDGDWTVFFDYAQLPDDRFVLDAVVNSESGGFIMGFSYSVVDPDEAYDTALSMVNAALEGVYINNVRHDTEGWNQDPYYFARCVKNAVEGGKDKVERICLT